MRAFSLKSPRRRFLAALAVVIAGTPALAQQCRNLGDLRYLGNVANSSRSVWLSTTERGGFRLEAAQGNTTVDTWSKVRPGRRLSLSPFVSKGSGGVHRLFALGAAPNGRDCLIDTQNQKGGISLPPLPPGWGRPPIEPPPGGVTPELPIVRPPGGPGGPGGPGVPGRPQPPVVILPPGTVTPGRPTVPPPGVRQPRTAVVGTVAGDPGPDCVDVSGGKLDPARCDPTVAPRAAPLTTGRDLGPETLWNVWTDLQLTRIEKAEPGGTAVIRDAYFAAGADRLVMPGTVAGLQIEVIRSEETGFEGAVRQDTDTFAIGPYFATALNDRWTLSGLLTYGTAQRSLEVLDLTSDYDVPRLRANLTATGQYEVGSVYLRPRVGLDYTAYFDSDYALSGTVLGRPVTVDATAPFTGIGAITPEIEIGRAFVFESAVVVPFADIGATYAFDGGTASATGERWTDLSLGGRIGIRAQAFGGLFAEASLGSAYLFEDGVEGVTGGLYLAWSF